MTREHHQALALVTGADSGIGQAAAKLLATEGYDVGVTFHTDSNSSTPTRLRRAR
jgi:NAD(P)-dependent dehydrogenase (short-subunit alcohol dehydrogenase family)